MSADEKESKEYYEKIIRQKHQELQKMRDMFDEVIPPLLDELDQKHHRPVPPIIEKVDEETSMHDMQQKKLKKKKKIIYIVFIAIFLFFPIRLKVKADGQLIPYHQIEVIMPRDGIIEKIAHQDGEIIKEGELLFEIEHDELKYQLLALEKQKVLLARKKDLLQEKNEYFANKFKRREELFKKNAVSREEYEKVAFDFHEATKEFQMANIEIEAISLKIDAFSREVEKSFIKSPIDGVILARDIRNRRNKFIEKGEELAKVGDLSFIVVEANSDNKNLLRINEGQDAVVRFRSKPNKWYAGKVLSVSQETDTELLYGAKRRPVYFYVTLEEKPEGLMPGAESKVLVTYSRGALFFKIIDFILSILNKLIGMFA